MSEEKYNLENVDVDLFDQDLEYDLEIDEKVQNGELEQFLEIQYGTLTYENGEDQIWIAEHPDLPGCRAEGETEDEARENLKDVKYSWMYSRLKLGLEIPLPEKRLPEERLYSGKISLRIPSQLHALLAKKAKSDNISMNQELIFLISKGLGNVEEDIFKESLNKKLEKMDEKIESLIKINQSYSSLNKIIDNKKVEEKFFDPKDIFNLKDSTKKAKDNSVAKDILKEIFQKTISLNSH
ncbi:type II toxin-antitoxin system HicB family antitoxin [Bacillus altitudinis]|uniref:type II toxin-antitoxin system HicB family antitoxin n=1 Tax=Bacillus altitudinis TaxID=293387 RepID=UPI003D1AA920